MESINWKRSLDVENTERPSDSYFKEHAEKLLNPKDMSEMMLNYMCYSLILVRLTIGSLEIR